MITLHMETDAVRALASQIKQAAEVMHAQMRAINGSAQSADWIGPSRDEFVAETQAIVRAIEAQADAGLTLAGRAEQETAEWEQAAASLGGAGTAAFTPFSGGGAWLALPFTALVPIFTYFTALPWLDGTPAWLRDLYQKFFPTPAAIPAPFPSVMEPTLVSPALSSQSTPLGELANQPSVTLQPAASSSASRPGYETYYDIVPKSQGDEYGNAACLPTSFSMLTYYYHQQNPANKVASPHDLVQMLDPGDGTSGRGIGFDRLDDDLGELGYKDVRYFQSDMSGLKNELKDGPLVVNVKVNLVSTPTRAVLDGNSYNHAMLVKGVSDSNVLVNDPWSGRELEIPSDQFERMWKNGDSWVHVLRP